MVNLFYILLRCGDKHSNPGLDSVTSTNSSISSVDSIQDTSNHLRIIHLNILSFLSKIDPVRCESHAYDIFVNSESWLKPEIKDDDIFVQKIMPLINQLNVEQTFRNSTHYTETASSLIDLILCRNPINVLHSCFIYMYMYLICDTQINY